MVARMAPVAREITNAPMSLITRCTKFAASNSLSGHADQRSRSGGLGEFLFGVVPIDLVTGGPGLGYDLLQIEDADERGLDRLGICGVPCGDAEDGADEQAVARVHGVGRGQGDRVAGQRALRSGREISVQIRMDIRAPSWRVFPAPLTLLGARWRRVGGALPRQARGVREARLPESAAERRHPVLHAARPAAHRHHLGLPGRRADARDRIVLRHHPRGTAPDLLNLAPGFSEERDEAAESPERRKCRTPFSGASPGAVFGPLAQPL